MTLQIGNLPFWKLALIGGVVLAFTSVALAKKPAKRFNSVLIKNNLTVEGSLTVAGTDGLLLLVDELVDDEFSWAVTGSLFNWLPERGALRMGYYEMNSLVPVGLLSFAGGEASVASGQSSWAYGSFAEATGDISFSFGYEAKSQGNESVAIGTYAEALGFGSLALGNLSLNHADGGLAVDGGQVYGDHSVALGPNTFANSYKSVVIGQYNVGNVTLPVNENDPHGSLEWVDDDPVFEVGVGLAEDAPVNALTILKNGSIGIGTENPQATLEVVGGVIIDGPLILRPTGDIPMIDYP